MFPAALAVALLAGVACSCPEGFNLIDFNLCASKIESFSWEEGHSECAHSGGPSAVLSPTGFSTWIVPPELKLPKWALPKELGMETKSVGQCRVMPGCVTMNQTCHGLLSVKITERGVCREKIGSTADESCDVVDEMGCEQSDWNATDKFDCFKHKEQHFVPSVNMILREDYATVSISNRHLLDDCWCILAKLDIFENNEFDAVVLSNLPPGSSFNITFPDSNYDFKQGALWCQCFDKWTGLMVKTDVFSTGFSSQRCDEHDPCTPSPCGPNSICREVVGSAACSCKPHYSGSPPNCHSECLINSDCPSNTSCIMQKCRDPCPGPCPFGSLCKVTDHEPQCTCPDGYVGDALVRCRPGPDAQKDLCSPSPCGPNAVCRGGLCGCRMEYKGDPYKGCKAECELNSECSASTACIKYKCVDPCPCACGRNATCAVENHKPICFCPAGATGNPFESCRTTHPCTPSPCGPNSLCREDGDSAVCSCKPHYIGSPPNCHSECLINSDCPSNTSCIMEKCRDPCPGPCSFASLCKVTDHEPQCTCPDGYVGDALVGCRKDRYPQKDLCSPSPCGPNAFCRGGLCGCRMEYKGDPYKGCKPECELNSECSASTACIINKCADPCPGTCGRNAVCAVENHKPMCFCPEGAAGNPFVSCRTTPLRRRWCVHVPPGDLEKAVAELDKAVEDVAASTSNVNDALRTLQRAFKSVHLMKGSNISFEGDAVSALILPKAIGVKDDGSMLSRVVTGDTAEDLARVTNVRAAVVLPEPQPVAFLVYKNVDAFQDGVQRIVSPVVEVFADVTFVDVVLRPSSTESDRRCAFWDFQTGSWNSSGCHLRVQGEVNDVCRCDHLTTFAQIVTDTRFLTATDEVVLDHVSVLGCTASLLGALGTLLATALSREWRSRKSTQVLLHLTAAVALRDALFVAAAREGRSSSRASCVAVGVLLHYAEMAAGAWCGVAGVLQVFRFATLSSRGITHLVLRCVLTAWPVAALPVVALLGARGPQVYAPGGSFAPGLCFPRGAPLLWAVTLPLCGATLANTGVFAFLVWTLCGFSKEQRDLIESRIGGPGLRDKALKCVVLFFLLGLPWLFGVPSGSRFLAYVFCVTATPQGLFLFLFFVLSNKNLRSSCSLTLKRNFAGYLESRKLTSDFSESSNHHRAITSTTSSSSSYAPAAAWP